MKLQIVSDCPKCGSKRTGFYIPYRMNEEEARSLFFKKGMRIRVDDFVYKKKKNCFCENCKFAWTEKPKKVRLSVEEFKQHLYDREFISEREKKKHWVNPDEEILREDMKYQKFKKIANILAYGMGIDIRRFNPYSKITFEEEDE